MQPLVLVFEDLHWIDAETQALLDSLVESLPTARLLLLVNYRPEYQHGWGSKTYYAQLRLDSLPPANAAALLQALLGDDASLAPLTQLLIDRTEGNPSFWKSVRTLVETGCWRQPGAYRLDAPLPTIQVPATVHAVLAARITGCRRRRSGFSRRQPSLAWRCPGAVTGHCRHARRGGASPPGALAGGRVSLQDAPVPRPGLYLQACLDTRGGLRQSPARATAGLHARLVEALETLVGDRRDEQVEHLAHHTLRGEVWAKAVTYCQQAGARAYDRAAFREAVASLSRPSRPSRTCPSQATPEYWLSISASRWHARCKHWESMGGASPWWARPRPARALDDRPRLGWVLTQIAHGLGLTGDLAGARAAGQQALALAAALGERLAGASHVSPGQLSHSSGVTAGRPRCGGGMSRRATGKLARPGQRYGSEPRRSWRRPCVHVGPAPRAGATEEALRRATLAGRGSAPALPHCRLGCVSLARGDLAPAIQVWEPGRASVVPPAPDQLARDHGGPG